MDSLPPEMTSLIEKYLQKRYKICIEVDLRPYPEIKYSINLIVDNELNIKICNNSWLAAEHIRTLGNLLLKITLRLKNTICPMPEEIINDFEEKIMEHNFGIDPLMKYEHFI